jgi:hypothetical protein
VRRIACSDATQAERLPPASHPERSFSRMWDVSLLSHIIILRLFSSKVKCFIHYLCINTMFLHLYALFGGIYSFLQSRSGRLGAESGFAYFCLLFAYHSKPYISTLPGFLPTFCLLLPTSSKKSRQT